MQGSVFQSEESPQFPVGTVVFEVASDGDQYPELLVVLFIEKNVEEQTIY